MAGMFLPGFAIWRAARATDGQGGWTEMFELQRTVMGRLSPVSASEALRGDRDIGVVMHTFATPSATDIIPGDQVRYAGRIARVDAVRVTSSGRRKECLCEEVS